MWTHQMPDSPVRQQRERLYRERSTELLAALQVLAKSPRPVLAEFGRHWLEDYELWLEHTGQKRAA